ncbi:vitamin K-dependent protein C [Drosophila mauritiana]|uniref:Vitamin K-dependent protein C n=1 Tax=Drosophila mauritiana TaxID=7226 RepID=A0A6P8KRP2_DROMA|nr:vitamin K-dependent protein C [Drosophila mauritiana]
MDSVVIGISALLFLLPVPGSSQYLDGRCGLLSNGKIANNISSPWMAYLHTSELLYVCGGTVITEKLVLTAAHCTRANEQLVAHVGEFMGTEDANDTMLSEHQVSQTFIHPLYNTTTNANDIAILGLATDIVFSKTIRPICIVWWTIWRNYIDNIQVLSGAQWGLPNYQNESDAFRIIEIRRQPANMCSTQNGTAILSSQFCAGDSDSKLCNVDFSSPLGAIISFKNFRRYVLIGIATTNQKCKRASVYTDVLSHTDFILSVWRQYHKSERSPKTWDLQNNYDVENTTLNANSED